MKISTSALIMILGLSFSMYGQKAKTEKIVVKQFHLPSSPLSSHIKTFAVNFNSEYDKIPNYKETSLDIKGYERVSIEEANVVIKLEVLDGKLIAKSDTKVITSNNNGKAEVKMNITVNSSIELKCTLIDKNGLVIHNIQYPNYDETTKTTYKTSAIAASTNPETAFKRHADNAINHTLKITLSKAKNATQDYLDKHFSYYTEEINFNISTGKGGKFYYSDLDKALDKFKQGAQIYSEKQLTKDVETLLTECVQIWENATKEYKPGDKKSRISDKNISEIYHNISVAYYLLDKFDDALEWAEKEKSFGKKETLIDKINERKHAKLMESNKKYNKKNRKN